MKSFSPAVSFTFKLHLVIGYLVVPDGADSSTADPPPQRVTCSRTERSSRTSS